MAKPKINQTNLLIALSYGVGMAGGVITGMLISKRWFQARHMPFVEILERQIAQEQGQVQASLVVNAVEARYWELFCHRPRVVRRALRKHLNTYILPGLALYQITLEEGVEMADALWKVERFMAEATQTKRLIFRLAGRLPAYYQMLRLLTPRVLDNTYPPEGWELEWVENSPKSLSFNMKSCFYLDMLTAYGAPELTLVYCHLDDLIFEDASPGVHWERSQTLARGDELCNFRWTRVG